MITKESIIMAWLRSHTLDSRIYRWATHVTAPKA